MSKRLFEILDEMNIHDSEHETRLVEASGNFIATRTIKAGTVVEMGIPVSSAIGLFDEAKIPLLLLIDRKEYEKRKTKPS